MNNEPSKNAPENNTIVACRFTAYNTMHGCCGRRTGLGLGRFPLFRLAANCQRLKPTRPVGQVTSLEDSLRLGLRRAAIAGNFTMHGTLGAIACGGLKTARPGPKK
jgi:hypothetical protein